MFYRHNYLQEIKYIYCHFLIKLYPKVPEKVSTIIDITGI